MARKPRGVHAVRLVIKGNATLLLRSRGVSVWLDESQIDVFAAITGEIRNGLANSKALLPWYQVHPSVEPINRTSS
jgi:hypothetical protein